jgi:hypothetical protein
MAWDHIGKLDNLDPLAPGRLFANESLNGTLFRFTQEYSDYYRPYGASIWISSLFAGFGTGNGIRLPLTKEQLIRRIPIIPEFEENGIVLFLVRAQPRGRIFPGQSNWSINAEVFY